MTRLDYMRLTPGQRKDVRDHLKASGYGLAGVPAEFSDFVAPHVGGRCRHAGGRDGTVRSQNRHGMDVEDLRQGFVFSEAESGNGRRADDPVLKRLFKPQLRGE